MPKHTYPYFSSRFCGRVADPSGLGVPNAQVRVTRQSTDAMRETLTSTDGVYRLELLDPGDYDLRATAPGFKTFEGTGVHLQVAQSSQFNVSLEVGATTDSVMVQAAGFAALGQSPEFAAASVKPSTAAHAAGMGGRWQTGPGSITMTNVTLRTCAQWAYDLKPYQFSAPEWFDAERFDIVAKSAERVPTAQLRLMMQVLLAERFKLAAHSETRVLAMFALLVGKGAPNCTCRSKQVCLSSHREEAVEFPYRRGALLSRG